MDVIFFVLYIFPLCLCCNAKAKPKSRAEIIEDYILSARFDDNVALPHVRYKENYEKPTWANKKKASREDTSSGLMSAYFRPEPSQVDYASDHFTAPSSYPKERDLLAAGQGYHQEPSPLPLAPVAPLSPHSVYVVGFMSFLILLSVLQGTLVNLTMKPGLLGNLLGTPGKPAGRRRRFARQIVYINPSDSKKPGT